MTGDGAPTGLPPLAGPKTALRPGNLRGGSGDQGVSAKPHLAG